MLNGCNLTAKACVIAAIVKTVGRVLRFHGTFDAAGKLRTSGFTKQHEGFQRQALNSASQNLLGVASEIVASIRDSFLLPF
jgi:hypothetical protein